MCITLLAHRFVGLVVTALAMTVAVTTTVSAQQGATYEIVSSFQVAEGRPNGVIQTRDGQFYGTTGGGARHPSRCRVGPYSRWMPRAHVRRCTRSTSTTSLARDGTPMSNLFEGADGSLYGTMYNPVFRRRSRQDRSSGLALQATSRPSIGPTPCELE